MKSIVGVVFTDHPIKHLENIGFILNQRNDTEVFGYREFICHFLPGQGLNDCFEIREVLDENLYFNFCKKENFAPFISENSSFLKPVVHPNSVYCIEEILTESMPSCELSHYLSVKKRHPLWALKLKCNNLQTFAQCASEEKKVIWKNQDCFLTQLGPSCFDLVIS